MSTEDLANRLVSAVELLRQLPLAVDTGIEDVINLLEAIGDVVATDADALLAKVLDANASAPRPDTISGGCDHLTGPFAWNDGDYPRCADCGHVFSDAHEYQRVVAQRNNDYGRPTVFVDQVEKITVSDDRPDMVNHPPHYKRGPRIELGHCDTYGHLVGFTRPTVQYDGKLYIDVECIEVIEHIRDGRLFTAMKYLWRVAFGGKADDVEDIDKSVWYHNRWKDHPLDRSAPTVPPAQ